MKPLLIFFLSVLMLSCFEKDRHKTYYLSENGKIAADSLKREHGRKEAKTFFSKQSKMPYDSIYLDVINLDTILKKDSVIIIYKETYYFGKPSQEKLIIEKKWNNFVISLINKNFFNKDFKTIDNKFFNSASIKGKPTLVNLWFTSCAPCIEEIPFLNKLKEKFGISANFISLTFDDKNKVENFLKKKEFDFIHIINEKSFLDGKNVTEYPINIFLDKNGKVTNVEGNIPMSKNEDGSIKADLKYFEDILNKLL